MLIVLAELKLHHCELVGGQPARRHSRLALGHVPDDDVCVLCLFGLASASSDITLVRGSDAEHLKDVAVQLLLLRPQGASHKNVFDWGFCDGCEEFFVFVLVGQYSDWVELGSSAAFELLVDSRSLVGKQDGRLVHQPERLLFCLRLNQVLNLLVAVAQVKYEPV